MYALVEYSGKQIRVEEGTKVKIPFISDKVGSKIVFDKVLFFDNSKNKLIGKPYINGITVNAKIAEHKKEQKITVFKFKRRKGYQRKHGHQQNYTLVEITKINTKRNVKSKETEASNVKTATKTTKAKTATKTTKAKTAAKTTKAKTKQKD